MVEGDEGLLRKHRKYRSQRRNCSLTGARSWPGTSLAVNWASQWRIHIIGIVPVILLPVQHESNCTGLLRPISKSTSFQGPPLENEPAPVVALSHHVPFSWPFQQGYKAASASEWHLHPLSELCLPGIQYSSAQEIFAALWMSDSDKLPGGLEFYGF